MSINAFPSVVFPLNESRCRRLFSDAVYAARRPFEVACACRVRSEAMCAAAHEHGSHIRGGGGRDGGREGGGRRGQMRCFFLPSPSSPAAIISWRWSAVSHCGF